MKTRANSHPNRFLGAYVGLGAGMRSIGLLLSLSLFGASWVVANDGVSGRATVDTPPARGGNVVRSGSWAGGAPSSDPLPMPSPSPGASEGASAAEQAKFYERANENLAVQVVYIEQRLDSLKQFAENIQGDLKDEGVDLAKKLTSGYCDKSAKDDAIECINQYREIEIGKLREIRSALLHNQDTLAQLKIDIDVTKRAGGAQSQKRATLAGATKSKALPSIPRYVDLGAVYSEEAQPEQSKRNEEIRKWVKQVLRAPEEKDFLVTEKIPLNPDKPKGETFSRIKRNADGTPVVDKQAYQKALETYARMAKLRRGSSPGDQKALQEKVSARMIEFYNQQKKRPETFNEATFSEKGLDAKECKDLQPGPRQDYCFARAFIVQYFNGEIGSNAQQDQQASLAQSGQARKPAKVIPPREDHVLKPPKSEGKGGQSVDALYMDPVYIDDVIKSQYPE